MIIELYDDHLDALNDRITKTLKDHPAAKPSNTVKLDNGRFKSTIVVPSVSHETGTAHE